MILNIIHQLETTTNMCVNLCPLHTGHRLFFFFSYTTFVLKFLAIGQQAKVVFFCFFFLLFSFTDLCRRRH